LTTWSPDTCKCIIDDIEKSNAFFLNRCRIHQAVTVSQVLAHNRSFSVTNYNLPKQAWHNAKRKREREEVLTPLEEQLFIRKQQMLTDKATEKATT